MDRAEFGLCVIILCLGVPKLKILSVRIFQELFVGTVLDYFSAVENNRLFFIERLRIADVQSASGADAEEAVNALEVLLLRDVY